MKHLFVPYELAAIAKEKDFDEPCMGYWNDEVFNWMTDYHQNHGGETNSEFEKISHLVAAPIYQQLIDWFKEKYSLHIVIECDFLHGEKVWDYRIIKIKEHEIKHNIKDCIATLPSFYSALNDALTEAFKLI